jgi:predicted GNAT family N-acyltransferase
MIKIVQFSYNEFTLRDLAFGIRTRVFVEEQHVDPELEYDEYEQAARHYLIYQDDQAVGTARWRETSKGIKLERFAVLPLWRNKDIGKEILKAVLEDTVPSGKRIYLHAQTRAVPFYERAGFIKRGVPFWEAGIEHYLMEYEIS